MKNGERPRRDLRERTFKFARQIIRLFASLDRGVLAQTLGRQLLRAGTSVGANYREADQARSKAEFVAKIGDCLKEADETAYWLELMSAENVGAPADLAPAFDEATQLVAIFTTIKRRAESND
ncbi:MAG: four helix bundle protein [Verrucomicrobia bacterium]|nr:four helix bundle protein [Verrucomicrobiota bacterium]